MTDSAPAVSAKSADALWTSSTRRSSRATRQPSRIRQAAAFRPMSPAAPVTTTTGAGAGVVLSSLIDVRGTRVRSNSQPAHLELARVGRSLAATNQLKSNYGDYFGRLGRSSRRECTSPRIEGAIETFEGSVDLERSCLTSLLHCSLTWGPPHHPGHISVALTSGNTTRTDLVDASKVGGGEVYF